MRVRYAEATGNCYGQFVIEPENESERTALTNMVRLVGREKAIFRLHGICYRGHDGLIQSFNCGFEDNPERRKK